MATQAQFAPLTSPHPSLSAEAFWTRIIGWDGGLAEVVDHVRRVLGHRINVLVEGESGTGKDLIARALHDGDPVRRRGPFVPVNCAAIPDHLVEAELFGHRQGAFTGARDTRDGYFQQADGGTLFLDEIGELPMPLQPKLLRALQEGAVRRVGDAAERRVDVRVVAATNRDLTRAVDEGRFRMDLYYRVADYPIYVPPLRHRPQDILPLARHFLKLYRDDFERPGIECFTPAARAWLQSRTWARNNVRELSRTVKQAVLVCDTAQIEPQHLGLSERTYRPPLRVHPGPYQPRGTADPSAGAADGEGTRPGQPPLKLRTQRFERGQVQAALEETQGNLAAAARLLGVSRSTLFDRMRKLGLRRADYLSRGAADEGAVDNQTSVP